MKFQLSESRAKEGIHTNSDYYARKLAFEKFCEWSLQANSDYAVAWQTCEVGEWMEAFLAALGHSAVALPARRCFRDAEIRARGSRQAITDPLWNTYQSEKRKLRALKDARQLILAHEYRNKKTPEEEAVYRDAVAQTENDYQHEVAPLEAAFDAQSKVAHEKYEELMVQHQKVYADAIREKVTTDQLLGWLAEYTQQKT